MAAETNIDLGALDDVSHLFSYPNNFNEVGYLAQSIEKTIEIYLSSSIRRDGLTPSSNFVSVRRGPRYSYSFEEVAASYGDYLGKYFAAGSLGLKGSRALNQEGRWQYNWHFSFLTASQ